jgi:hypothetical protein
LEASDVNARSEAKKHELFVVMASHDLILKELGFFLCGVNQPAYKSITKQFMAQCTPTWTMNYKGVEDW